MFSERYTMLRDIGYNPFSAFFWAVVEECVTYSPPEHIVPPFECITPFDLAEWNSQHEDKE